MRQPKNLPSFTACASGPVRLDLFLAAQSAIKSRVAGRKLIEQGMVSVNGVVTLKVARMLSTGDRIFCLLPAPTPEISAAPASMQCELPILYEDDHCMVVNKPAGISVHPGVGMKPSEVTILTAARALFRARRLPFSSSEVLVHRLDKGTTGCLLIAKTREAHLDMQQQFAERSVRKVYLAIVAGRPRLSKAMIDAPIGRSSHNRTKMSVHHGSRRRSARTTYTVLSSSQQASLLSCDLHTGRTHQIRVHLASIGHPLLGDASYGNDLSRELSKQIPPHVIGLHAWKLSFRSSLRMVTVLAPLPSALSLALESLGLTVGT